MNKEELTKGDMEFIMKWESGQMEHNPDNCQYCGYCTGEPGAFSFDCLKED